MPDAVFIISNKKVYPHICKPKLKTFRGMEIKKKTTEINEENIRLLVDNFYDKAKQHPDIGPIFNDKIKDQWDAHLEKLYRFWETHLLNVISYTGSPFPKHNDLELKPMHFETWTTLFYQTIDEIYEGEAASMAKKVAGTFVKSFLRKF